MGTAGESEREIGRRVVFADEKWKRGRAINMERNVERLMQSGASKRNGIEIQNSQR